MLLRVGSDFEIYLTGIQIMGIILVLAFAFMVGSYFVLFGQKGAPKDAELSEEELKT
ncbi:MAG: hypothetical protein QW400_02270 [Candidatus Diapherotrites archaeon]